LNNPVLNNPALNNPFEREAILADVMKAAAGLTQDWDREFAAPIAPETRLMADLGCQSLDIIVLTGQLSRQLRRNDIPFERLLLANGKPVSDVTVGALADFLWEQTQGAPT
jgi:acyl carrier protein